MQDKSILKKMRMRRQKPREDTYTEQKEKELISERCDRWHQPQGYWDTLSDPFGRSTYERFREEREKRRRENRLYG